jgi:GDPmannose 4,6-dehydratase
MTKIACITGITGQTGSYLTRALLQEEYQVVGLIRRSSNFNTQRIDDIYDHPDLKLVYGDLSDSQSLSQFVSLYQPDLFLNLGAMSHVKVSFEIPEYTFDVVGTGVMRCLEAIRNHSPHTRFLQASSSEMFGSHPPPQNEETPFHPRSPYAVAKVAAYHAVVNYREAYKMFCCNAISYNHESKVRGETFVTRKITRAATRIKLGLQDKLYLGNLNAKRDWGHAADTADAMLKIIMHDDANDYVVATGEMHSVQDFVDAVFDRLGLDKEKHIEFDPRYLRPSEVEALCGDATKIKTKLGWEPKYSFEDLVDEMVTADLKMAEQEKLIRDNS